MKLIKVCLGEVYFWLIFDETKEKILTNYIKDFFFWNIFPGACLSWIVVNIQVLLSSIKYRLFTILNNGLLIIFQYEKIRKV